MAHTSVSDAPIDPRHQRRIDQMQALFAYTFSNPNQTTNNTSEPSDTQDVVPTFLKHQAQIDAIITRLATEHRLEDISRVDLSVLRCILLEWLTTNTPRKVLIDEAVELAKAFGATNSPKFINGVLQSVLNEELSARQNEPS